jgi:hypothetical protein
MPTLLFVDVSRDPSPLFPALDTSWQIELLYPPEPMVRILLLSVELCSRRAGPRSYIHPNREGIDGVTGAEVADGEVECMKAVRRQISAGADVVKVGYIMSSC